MKNKKEKIINIYYKISYVLEFLLSIPMVVYILLLANDKVYTDFWIAKWFWPAVIFSILVLAIVISIIVKYKNKLEKIFIAFAIPIGMIYTIFILPTYVPDENVHLYRAYQVSIGNFIEDGDEITQLPTNILQSTIDANIRHYGDIFNNIKGNNDYEEKSNVSNIAKSYFPTLYMFSAIGMAIGQGLSLNPIITMYLAKMFNFIAYLVLGYYTIKKLPFGKLVMLTYLMIPMVLQQATSISADALTNSVSLFFIAYTLQLVKREKIMTKKEEILYYILVVFISLAKIAYMPLVVLSWLFVGNKNYTKSQKTRIILISTILGIICSIGWFGYSSLNYSDPRSYLIENGVNSSEQISFILHHPVQYIKIMLYTVYTQGEGYIYMFMGKNLGWLNIDTSLLTIIAFIILLLVSPFLSKEEKTLNNKERLWIFTIFIGIFVLVLTGLYLGWTGVGASPIQGVQGRYFIPTVILILLCLCIKEKSIEFKYTKIAYPIALSFLNLWILRTIFYFFV